MWHSFLFVFSAFFADISFSAAPPSSGTHYILLAELFLFCYNAILLGLFLSVPSGNLIKRLSHEWWKVLVADTTWWKLLKKKIHKSLQMGRQLKFHIQSSPFRKKTCSGFHECNLFSVHAWPLGCDSSHIPLPNSLGPRWILWILLSKLLQLTPLCYCWPFFQTWESCVIVLMLFSFH